MRKTPPRNKRVIRPRRRPATPYVTRGEFDAMINLFNGRGEIINGIQRDLQTQFTRIAQLQQEIDAIKRQKRRIR